MIKVSIPAQENRELKPHIVVIGVGGAGGNAVDNMIANELEGVNFVVCNTDAQALTQSQCDKRVQLGTGITQGLGAGSDPDVGRAAAEESIDEVMSHLEGMNMAFITCGMGGGTGTGAAPVIARAAREKGLLTVGVVTKPFKFEGANRMKLAEDGIREMQEYVDTLIVIPNQNLFRIANDKTTFAEAFKMADGVLQSGVRGVTDLMIKPGMINLDFADVRCTMREMGKAMMGTGEASGDNRATEAAEAAINNPLLDDISMKGARGVIINITGGYDMTLMEVEEVCERIGEEVDDNANIIFGSTFDDRLEGVIRVSVVATGIDSEEKRSTKPLRPATVNTTHIGGQNEDNAPQRVKPLASSSNTNTGMDGSGIMQGRPGEGHMPSAAPSAPSRAPDTIPEQKVVGSDMSYDASAFSTHGTNTSRMQTSGASTAFGNTSATSAAPSAPQLGHAETLRGARHGTAFIPPRAAQPADMETAGHTQVETSTAAEPAPAEKPAAPFGFNTNTTQTPRGGEGPQPQGLKLNPPSLPTPETRTHGKAPSLFERMTGMVRQFAGQEEVDEFDSPRQNAPQTQNQTNVSAPQGQGYSAPQMQTAPNTPQQEHSQQHGQQPTSQGPVQGQLDIALPDTDAKDGGSSSQNDLDIPAFLRRQAN